uniref:Uncharacterized protein n=1 Tax=Setaria viridis TaxID=4556 RepID=A0A4V6D8Z8_SETVI|nr:hypothetical protein SEVIR_6G253032v2 [Setaria viridis]
MFQLLAARINCCMMISRSSKRQMPIARDRDFIYKLRKLRRKTLLRIYFLNKVSTPLSRSTVANSISWLLPANNSSLLKCLVDNGSFAGTQGRNLFRQKIRQGFKHGDRNLSGFSQLLDPAALLIS